MKNQWVNRIKAIALSTFLMSTLMSTATAADKFKVVTTFTVIQDIARNVAGDAAEVVSITKPGAEIHGYQPTPGDILKVQSADLVLWNGLNLERWFKRFFSQVNNVPSVVVSDGIEPQSIYEGPYSGKPNPHAWMSPTNGLIYIDNIRQALVKYDPENTATYNANAKAYSEKLKALDNEIRQKMQKVPEKQRYLVSSEGAFSYLAKDYGMKEAYLWPINAEQQGTPQQIKRLIDKIRAENIPVIFSESTISDKPAKQIAAETNARYGGVLYVDSLSEPDGVVPTYFDLLRVTTQTMVDGFGVNVPAGKQ